MTFALANLSDLICLPDPEAAEALNERMAVWMRIDKLQERSFVERGLIIREFERRKLWAYLVSPETGQPFPHLTAWLSCDNFLGCRRTNFEAKRTLEMLQDVPAEKLVDIPRATSTRSRSSLPRYATSPTCSKPRGRYRGRRLRRRWNASTRFSTSKHGAAWCSTRCAVEPRPLRKCWTTPSRTILRETATKPW